MAAARSLRTGADVRHAGRCPSASWRMSATRGYLGKYAADHVAAGQPAESSSGTDRGVRRLAVDHGRDVLALGGRRAEIGRLLKAPSLSERSDEAGHELPDL